MTCKHGSECDDLQPETEDEQERGTRKGDELAKKHTVNATRSAALSGESGCQGLACVRLQRPWNSAGLGTE